MTKPTLLVMAAGMGSRYGGLKQIDSVGDRGEIIMDFSLYDAMMAGFDRVVFVVKEEHEQDLRDRIDDRAGRFFETVYVHQKMDDLPEGYSVPEGRTKPWGTMQAVLAARDVIDGPFAVINADDYYGPGAFHIIYDQLEKLAKAQDEGKTADPAEYAMVGFQLEKTLSENGSVARGICQVTGDGYLKNVVERTKIQAHGEGTAYTEDDGASWIEIPAGSTVSMNFWGFTPSIFHAAWNRFPEFLDTKAKADPLKGEFFLPTVVQEQIDEGSARVKVLQSSDKWYGVTYREDRETIVDALRAMKDRGVYPETLWHDVKDENVVWK